jgi:flagellar basal-body rod modification protein FlgD
MMPISSTQSAGTAGSTKSPSGSGSTDQLTNESTFLQLLVAQIQNQDPLNPTDSMQFIGQLVSFSQLEQLLSINQNLQTLIQDATPPSTAPTTPSSSPGTTN